MNTKVSKFQYGWTFKGLELETKHDCLIWSLFWINISQIKDVQPLKMPNRQRAKGPKGRWVGPLRHRIQATASLTPHWPTCELPGVLQRRAHPSPAVMPSSFQNTLWVSQSHCQQVSIILWDNPRSLSSFLPLCHWLHPNPSPPLLDLEGNGLKITPPNVFLQNRKHGNILSSTNS